MEPQTTNQNNQSLGDQQENSSKMGLKLIGLEISIFLPAAISILLVLNYFNVLSLSDMFPSQLSWLPTQKEREAAIVPVIDTPTEEKVPPISETSFEVGTIEHRLSIYAKEVLRPEFIPTTFETSISHFENYQVYFSEHLNDDLKIILGYTESIRSELYTEARIPLDISINVVQPLEQDENISNFKEIIEKYYVNLPEPLAASNSSILEDGASVTEIVWDNPDGTKESRYIHGVNLSGGDREIVQAIAVGACRLYKDSPQHDKNSCF